MKSKSINFKWLIPVIALLFTLSCRSTDRNGDDLSFRSTSSIRLDDIKKQIESNPVYALALVYVYREIYKLTNEEENEDWEQANLYEEEAKKNLIAAYENAIQEERWDEVISFNRTISNLGLLPVNENTQAAFFLADAKKKLKEGNNLAAFLTAVRAHEINPLDSESAVMFLGKAVEARQRRTSAFFLSAAERAGGGTIPAELRAYATGGDSPSDMIKGVATVIVDRGFTIERGRGLANRISGSAFFVDASGLLITNYHVIESEVDPKYKGYSRMYIRMGDSASPRIPARVVGWDKALDLALIKTEIETEYVFSIVDRVTPRIGDTVIAIGTPLGLLEKTVTSGIVSATGRRLLQIGDVIQIDAAINQGNSGGPVVDNQGRLIGVAFAGMPQFQGLNFIIPAERLAAALPQMLKGGRAPRPWLGLTLCETFSGAEVVYTSPNTPASMHQIKDGSIIRSVNGRRITAQQGNLIPALQQAVFHSGPGELVVLETVDKDEVVKKRIMLTIPRPDVPLLEAAKIDRRERLAAPLFGMVLAPLQSGLFSTSYRVSRIVRGSASDEAGISVDDPVTINRFRLLEEQGIAVMEISVKKRRMGYLETSMMLPAWLDSPDTL